MSLLNVHCYYPYYKTKAPILQSLMKQGQTAFASNYSKWDYSAHVNYNYSSSLIIAFGGLVIRPHLVALCPFHRVVRVPFSLECLMLAQPVFQFQCVNCAFLWECSCAFEYLRSSHWGFAECLFDFSHIPFLLMQQYNFQDFQNFF